MNWDAIGAIGELVGAIGVIATLAYLAVQIKNNTTTSRANTYQGFNSEVLALRRFRIENPHLERFWELRFDERELLSDLEKSQFDNIVKYRLQLFEGIAVQTSRGVIEGESWTVARRDIATMVENPGFSDWWEIYQASFTETFQQEIAQLRGGRT